MTVLIMWAIGMGAGFAAGVFATLALYHRAMSDHYQRLIDVRVIHGRRITREDVEMSLQVMDESMDAVRLRDALTGRHREAA